MRMGSNDTQPTPSAASVFLRALLVRIVLLALLVAGLDIVVNPFGSYPVHVFEPIALSTRRPKLRLYEQRQPAPEIVLLGSSRSFAMEPAYVQERTSRPAFNAAVHAASTGDYLNLARCFARGRRAFPALLIVGLGVEQMVVEAQAVERPDPLLQCAGAGGWRTADVLRRYRGLITLEEAWASLRLLALELNGRPAPRYGFAPDGMIVGSETSPLDQAVDDGLSGNWRPGIFAAERLRPGSVAQVRELLELCRDHGSRVIVYLPPYHPRATARYLAESRFAPLRAQLLDQLAAWRAQFPLEFHDFTEVSRFGARDEMFYDASHPREEAFRLMVELMLASS
jgi:hypothetical protein